MTWNLPERRTKGQHVQSHVHLCKGSARLGVAALVILAAACTSPAAQPAAGNVTAQAAAQAPAQPETEAGVRAAATAFYALYAAGQWPQAWAMLAPASQAAAPEDVYAAVHQGCPSPSAGAAREIKSVTMAGNTAVVTESLAGALSAVATQADAFTYAGGRWGYVLDAATLAAYSHGSAAADIAALKAAGRCAS